MLRFWPDAIVRNHQGKETEMAKKKGNAGSKKPAAKAKSRASAEAQKNRAAKDAAAVKAVLDAEAVREADKNLAAEEQSRRPR